MVSVADAPNADGVQPQFACICLYGLHSGDVGNIAEASFRRLKSGQKIVQIGVGNDLSGFVVYQVAVINRHITAGRVKLSFDALRGCGQGNDLGVSVPHGSFNAALGNGVCVGLLSESRKIEQAMELIADDVLKMGMEVRILFQEDAEFSVGDDDNTL